MFSSLNDNTEEAENEIAACLHFVLQVSSLQQQLGRLCEAKVRSCDALNLSYLEWSVFGRSE